MKILRIFIIKGSPIHVQVESNDYDVVGPGAKGGTGKKYPLLLINRSRSLNIVLSENKGDRHSGGFPK